jgi:hypothetical protein
MTVECFICKKKVDTEKEKFNFCKVYRDFGVCTKCYSIREKCQNCKNSVELDNKSLDNILNFKPVPRRLLRALSIKPA